MKKVLALATMITVAMSLGAVPALAATPTLSATQPTYDPSYDDYYFHVFPSRGWVPDCDLSTLEVGLEGTVIRLGDLDYAEVFGGWNEVGERYAEVSLETGTYDLETADYVAIECTVKWRTSTYETKVYYANKGKAGVNTSSRSWSRLSLGGSCNYSGLDGSLLVTCLFAKSVVTHNITTPRGTTIVAGSVSKSPGLYGCHTSVQKTLTSRRSMRFTITTANANGFAQCWIDRVGVRYKGTKRVQVWTTRRADGVSALWESGLSSSALSVDEGSASQDQSRRRTDEGQN